MQKIGRGVTLIEFFNVYVYTSEINKINAIHNIWSVL